MGSSLIDAAAAVVDAPLEHYVRTLLHEVQRSVRKLDDMTIRFDRDRRILVLDGAYDVARPSTLSHFDDITLDPRQISVHFE